jgi:hypothetical protein
MKKKVDTNKLIIIEKKKHYMTFIGIKSSIIQKYSKCKIKKPLSSKNLVR